MITNLTETRQLLSSIRKQGVQLLIGEDGGLRARGGNFTPELRRAASEQKKTLAMLVQMEQAQRESNLADAKSSWLRHATPERGFFIGGLQNAVTAELKSKLDKVEADYLNGIADLRDVHEAFVEFAKASRRRYVNRQLVGEIYHPALGGKKAEQITIHRKFQEVVSTDGDDDTMKRMFRSSVTPQIEPQDDQLERMKVYFGTDRTEYIANSSINKQGR